MTILKSYPSDALPAIHEKMEGLHGAGAIDHQTLPEFDEACLAPAEPPKDDEFKAVREAQHVS
jgi:putative transcriptional regulator